MNIRNTSSIMNPGYQQGLIGIKERITLLNGQFTIESSEGRGTRMDVDIPMVGLLGKQNTDKRQNNDGLTAREMEMLVLIAKGMLAKEIARTLAISEKTVRNHISTIYRKLNIYDRSQLVIYAVRKGLIEINDSLIGNWMSTIFLDRDGVINENRAD